MGEGCPRSHRLSRLGRVQLLLDFAAALAARADTLALQLPLLIVQTIAVRLHFLLVDRTGSWRRRVRWALPLRYRVDRTRLRQQRREPGRRHDSRARIDRRHQRRRSGGRVDGRRRQGYRSPGLGAGYAGRAGQCCYYNSCESKCHAVLPQGERSGRDRANRRRNPARRPGKTRSKPDRHHARRKCRASTPAG